MKRNLLTIAALTVSLVTSGVTMAQSQTASGAPTQGKPQKLAKVATIRGADAVREFERNVQLLQAQRKAAVDMGEQLEKEKNPEKKKELKANLDKLMAKLNENNAAMSKAYGFSLTRNYTMEIESANIYTLVSDEEAAKIEQEQKAATKKK